MKKLFANILVALDGATATYARRAGLAVLVAAMLSSTALYAQYTSGNIVGTVTDKTGALVPNAQVTATNTQTNVKYPVNANGNGEYRIDNLPPGIYDVSATAPGFNTQTEKGFEVQLNKQATLVIHMAPKGAAETVEVSAAAAVALDTTTVQLQQTFSNQEVSELPTATVGLGVLNVSLLSPNVATSGGIGAGTGPSVGGQRPRANNFTIEGIDNNDKTVTGPLLYIPNDSVGEFTLITNQFSPEFGHSTGGQFNTTVLSGTNKFHGRAYEYFENRDLNAIDATVARSFAPGTKPFNPRFDNNRYGGQFGGPLKRDRLFFFGAYEYQTLGQSAAFSICTPTAAGFAALNANPVYQAANGGANLAVLNKFVPVSANQVDFNADTACGNQAPTKTDADPLQFLTDNKGNQIPLGNFQVTAPSFQNTKALTTSGDWTISTNDSFRLRYLYNQISLIDTAASLPAFFLPQVEPFHLAALSEFHNFTPNLTNEARVGFNRFELPVPAGNFTFPGLAQFPNITAFDLGGLNIGPDGNAPQSTVQNLYQFVDNISWVKGNHTLKFGFDGRKYISPQSFTQRVRGDYQYAQLNDFLTDVAPTTFGERSTGNFFYYGDQTAFYGYANDTWRVRPNLTLNYGLRYEFTSVPKGERLQSFNSAASVPGLITFHEPKPQYTNFAPRIGIDYAPNDKTSIRAGFGMAYDVIYDNLGILALPPQFSSTTDVNVPPVAGAPPGTNAGDPNFLANGGLPAGTGGLQTFDTVADQRAATAAFVPDQKLPYSETWSLGVQHVFGANYTAEVRYLGTRGIHLSVQDRINRQAIVTPTNFLPTDLTGQADPNNGTSTFSLKDVKANGSSFVPAYLANNFTSNITSFQPFGQSNYNALAGSLIRRFRNGLQLDFAYTWSKTMDDATADVFSTVLTPRRPFNFQCVACDYSRSALDRTHRVTLEAIYDLPFFKGSSNWMMKNIVGGWEVAPIYTYQSPEYATVNSPSDSSLAGGSNVTSRVIINPNGNKNLGSGVVPIINPSLSCGVDKHGKPIPSPCDANTVGYVVKNPGAYYVQAGNGALANSGRNTLPVRPTNDVDATAIKRVNIGERYSVEFQAQAFNLFNHPQFLSGSINTVNSIADTSASTTNYLQAVSGTFNRPDIAFSSNSRVLQLALKFIF